MGQHQAIIMQKAGIIIDYHHISDRAETKRESRKGRE